MTKARGIKPPVGPDDKRRDPATQTKANRTKRLRTDMQGVADEIATTSIPQMTKEQGDLADALPLLREKCKRNFSFFLDHVQILDTSGEAGFNPVVPFAKWPHLLDVSRAIQSERLVVILKARQIGVSWLMACYALWRALFNQGVVGLLISKSQMDAAALLDKCRFVHANLPKELQLPVGTNSQTELEFPVVMSKVLALSSTENAGRGETATFVVQDEADYHEYLDQNYAAIRPTIDAGGQIIMASTPNKSKISSLFKEVYRGAPQNLWSKLFLPWHVRPGRDQSWYAAAWASTPTSAAMDPELYMNQEYPADELEALRPARTQSYFDIDRLADFVHYCDGPMETRRAGSIRIWRGPTVAAKYVAGADVAWGSSLSSAFSCLTIIDWNTAEQVAEAYGRFSEDEYAQIIYDMCREYNEAFVGVENNGEGMNVVNKLVALGYGRRMFYEDHSLATPRKPGWRTSPLSRPVMLGEMAEMVRNNAVRPRSRESVQEMADTIRDEHGVVKAAQGAHFDRVMSWAIALQMRSYATFGNAMSRSGARVYIGARW